MADDLKLLFRHLAKESPRDAPSLQDAFEKIVSQHIETVHRLSQLTDSQWARLGIPLGVETLVLLIFEPDWGFGCFVLCCISDFFLN